MHYVARKLRERIHCDNCEQTFRDSHKMGALCEEPVNKIQQLSIPLPIRRIHTVSQPG